MLFVVLGSVKGSTSQQRIERRLGWSYPEGIRPIAEYWLQTPHPNMILVAEADDIAPIMAGNSQWDDLLDITVVPAVAADQGMKIAKQMMG
jgi:hypothetical protein